MTAMRIPFAASGIGSYWWEGAKLLKAALACRGVELDVNTRSSNVRNVLSVTSGESLLGITLPQFVDWAQRGLDVFANAMIPELCVVAPLNISYYLAAAVDRASGITSLKELAERRYPWKAVIPSDDNLVGIYIERIMREHGITRANLAEWGGADLNPIAQRTAAERASATGPNVMKSRTREYAESGTANGFFLYINGCSDWARDLTTLLDLRFLRFDEAVLDAINADWGATKLTLPQRLFPGVDEDIVVAGWRQHYIYGLPGVPDDVVRIVLSALEDERILDNTFGFSFSGFRPRLPASLKLHPATAAYYSARETA
jgi:TRAP-type uncharacterized transport system substrate-binding protein